MKDALKAFVEHLAYNRHLSPHSVRAYTSDVEQYLASVVAARGVKLSALTADTVPTPPAAAQAPDDIWLVADTPFPPSTSGSTSRPPMRMVLIPLNILFQLAPPSPMAGPSFAPI